MAELVIPRIVFWAFCGLLTFTSAAPHYNVYLGSSLPSGYHLNYIQPVEKSGWSNLENLRSTIAVVDEELGRSSDYGTIMLESGEEEDSLSRLLQNIQGQETAVIYSEEANDNDDDVDYDVMDEIKGDVTTDPKNPERFRRMAKKSKEKNQEIRPSKERKGSKEKNKEQNPPTRTKRMANRGGKRRGSREKCNPEGDGGRSPERKRSRERQHRHRSRERHGSRSREKCPDESTTTSTTTTSTTTPSTTSITTTSSTTTTTSSTTTTPSTTTASTTTTPTTTTTTTASTTPSTTTTTSTTPRL